MHEFVSEYWPDNLFAFIPGREHSAFTGFSDNMSITNPAGFRQRLNKYSVKLDMSREILPI